MNDNLNKILLSDDVKLKIINQHTTQIKLLKARANGMGSEWEIVDTSQTHSKAVFWKYSSE